jgi:hypothetical protein
LGKESQAPSFDRRFLTPFFGQLLFSQPFWGSHKEIRQKQAVDLGLFVSFTAE